MKENKKENGNFVLGLEEVRLQVLYKCTTVYAFTITEVCLCVSCTVC